MPPQVTVRKTFNRVLAKHKVKGKWNEVKGGHFFRSQKLRPQLHISITEDDVTWTAGRRRQSKDPKDYRVVVEGLDEALGMGLNKPTDLQRFLRWAQEWQRDVRAGAKVNMYKLWQENRGKRTALTRFFKDMVSDIKADSDLKRRKGSLILYRHSRDDDWKPPRGKIESYTTEPTAPMGIHAPITYEVEIPPEKVLLSYEHARAYFRESRGGEGEFLVLPGRYKFKKLPPLWARKSNPAPSAVELARRLKF